MLTDSEIVELSDLYQKKDVDQAREDFFEYCNLKAPDFYKPERTYLVDMCDQLQDFYQSDDEILIINLPPRHGKSRTTGCFVEWVLGQNQNEKIMTGSYNETLSTTFSKAVRDTIQEQKADQTRIIYSDIFPGVRIKYGDAAMNMWSLENGYNNYLATSPTGTATGFGASLMIIDDLIKNSMEANNADVLEKHWSWFTQTMLSRLEEGAKIIIVMTRWHSLDLAGRALDYFSAEGKAVRHVNYKAVQDDGTMLCDEILSRDSYESRARAMGIEIAEANYQQNPIDIKGRLYTSFKTYSKLPEAYKEIRNYTDTADTGDDYLCSLDYMRTMNDEAYVLDVLYTKEPMEITEPAQARMMHKDKVNIADIEANNGGRGYARAVEQRMRQDHGSNHTIFRAFHQTNNKQARIYSNSTWVMEHIYFPENWMDRWPEYYDAMQKYQKEGKNAHDDAQDATTGIAEKIHAGNTFSFD